MEGGVEISNAGVVRAMALVAPSRLFSAALSLLPSIGFGLACPVSSCCVGWLALQEVRKKRSIDLGKTVEADGTAMLPAPVLMLHCQGHRRPPYLQAHHAVTLGNSSDPC
jgi:hypothetical protein